MAEYAFVPAWRLQAPIDNVYDTILDSRRWPEWWDAVLTVEELGPGAADGLGNVRRCKFKGRLPYRLRFDTHTDVLDRPGRLGAVARGELEGRAD